MPAMACFETLPNELLGVICDHMPLADIQNLRLANRRFAKGSMQPYAQRAFACTSAACTLSGLQRLQLLSQHPSIAEVVRKTVVIINPHTILQEFNNCDNIVWPDESTREEGRAGRPMTLRIRIYAWVRKMLVYSLKALPQLEHIIIKNECTRSINVSYSTIDIRQDQNGIELDHDNPVLNRVYYYECVISVLAELQQKSMRLSVTIHHFDNDDDFGFVSAPLITGKMKASSETQQLVFGTDDFDVGPLIQKHLQELSLYGNERLVDQRWDMLLAASACPLKSLQLHRFNLTSSSLLFFGPGHVTATTEYGSICYQALHFPQLTDFTLSECQFQEDFGIFIEKHLPTLEKIQLIETDVRIDNAWTNLFTAFSQALVLQELHIDRGVLKWNRGVYTVRPELVETATWVGNENIRAKSLAVLDNGQLSRVPGDWKVGYLDLLSAT